MPTKRLDKEHWRMVTALLAIYGAMLLVRWTAMIWGWAVTNENSQIT